MKAFTLIELLIVLAVVALLAGIFFAVGGRMMTTARVTDTSQRMERILSGISSYRAEGGGARGNIQSS